MTEEFKRALTALNNIPSDTSDIDGDIGNWARKYIFEIRTALQSTRKPPVQNEDANMIKVTDDTTRVNLKETTDYKLELEIEREKFQKETLRTSELMQQLANLRTTPIDTINIKREVLQGVREKLCIARRDFRNWLLHQEAQEAAIASVDKGIASLDAVLSEGE